MSDANSHVMQEAMSDVMSSAPAAGDRAPETAAMGSDNETASVELEHPTVFFDGVCGMCNATVDFLMARDRHRRLRFAPLQGETAAAVLPREYTENLNSLCLRDANGTFRKSTAVVRILRHLGGFWSFMGGLLWLVPSPVRNLGYSVVARVRYRVFGKKETCRMPTPEERELFLP